MTQTIKNHTLRFPVDDSPFDNNNYYDWNNVHVVSMELEEELGPGLGAISPDKRPRTLPIVSVNADAEDLYSGIVDSGGAGICTIQLARVRNFL